MSKYILITAFAFCLFSCKTDISKIKENRSDYLGENVKIEGTVNITVPFTKIYEVKDETGTIYVEASSDLPNKDQKYTIKGIVREKKIGIEGFNLVNELYIEESNRK
jgi:hypothetical protein